MKKILLALLISTGLSAQQPEIHLGISVSQLGIENAGFIDIPAFMGTMPVYGVTVKKIKGPWGANLNWYQNTHKSSSFSEYVHQNSEVGTGQWDSTVYIQKMMGHGFTVGATYSFDFGLTLFANAGISITEDGRFVKMSEYTYYAPDSVWLVHKGYETSVTYENRTTKFCVDLHVDYDLLPKRKLSVGPRVGYNTQGTYVGMIFIGYNFTKE